MGLVRTAARLMAPTRERSLPVRTVVAVALASGLGGLARYGLGGLLARRMPASFPWETFTINVTGAFVLGILFTVFTERIGVAPWLRAATMIGFLGSYTTFSTWTLESYRLLEDGANGLALANLFGSLAAGLVATYAGVVVGRTL
jgi:fluoride exporter